MISAVAKESGIIGRDVETRAGKDTGPKRGLNLPHMYPQRWSAVSSNSCRSRNPFFHERAPLFGPGNYTYSLISPSSPQWKLLLPQVNVRSRIEASPVYPTPRKSWVRVGLRQWTSSNFDLAITQRLVPEYGPFDVALALDGSLLVTSPKSLFFPRMKDFAPPRCAHARK
jgi:hypothetical protein